jgi:putative ABC transport system substrate-binding protein
LDNHAGGSCTDSWDHKENNLFIPYPQKKKRVRGECEMRFMMHNTAEQNRGSSGPVSRRDCLAEPLTHGRRFALIVRYTFILSVTVGFVAASFSEAAQAQTPQHVFRIGLLAGGARTPDGEPPGPLREALRELGYVEGQNVEYESRFAEGRIERLSGMAAELVKLNVNVIVVLSGPAAEAAKRATSSIPIVIGAAAGDAVALGWIASLPHPGGNVTGLTDESVQLSAKRMQLLTEAVPKAARIAVLWNANDQGMTLRYRGIETAARFLHVQVEAFGVRKPDDFAVAFSTMTLRRPDALFLVADPMTSANRKRVIDFVATQRVPAMYEYDFIVRDGGLMSYGPSFEDSFRVAAFYVDRILKGAKPGDLPAEQPTRYYLTVNLKTAAALGLTLPPSLLMADQVIE